jgi:DNA mismatch repair ATPase MutS
MLSCHNSSVSDFLIMEEDCQDCDTVPSVHTKNEDPLDFNQVLSSIANHITTATDKMSSEFNQVMSDNRIFKWEVLDANDVLKQEVRTELQELRSLLGQYSPPLNTGTTPSSTGPNLPQTPMSMSSVLAGGTPFTKYFCTISFILIY